LPDSTAEVLRAEEAALRVPSGAEGGGMAGACLHQLFEGRTDAEPGAAAVVDGRTRISYQELEHRANCLAHRLRELGAGPEVRVAVCLERTADLIAALLAVLKAGAAYVPVDPAYPQERQAIILSDSGASILITRENLLSHLPAIPGRVLCLGRDQTELVRYGDTRPAPAGGPGNLAYLIYTSGSTGRPKAVGIEHRSAVALVQWSLRTYTRRELAGVLVSTSVCFDLSVFEIFATLAAGGALILAENALALPGLPAAGAVTLINTVPSAAAELTASGGIPPSVRVVNLAGEPLRAALPERLYRLEHVEKVYNLYGPSEDTTYSTWTLLRRGDPLPPSIGEPLEGTSVHLLDSDMRPVGTGEAGELYLGGAGLARGYLGRPDLTAQRFVPDPFAQSPGERLYATGDLARYRPSGELDFLGRLDQQVKIRGFRVELGEVEAALDRAPGVAATVIVAREFEGRDTVDKVLVAYVVPLPGTALDTIALRTYLQSHLPDALVPSWFVELPELPLTASGKVDRKALPAPDLTALPETYLPPRTPVEETLTAIWAEVLGLPRVGVEDDFFTLGGHSLLATRVLSRIRRHLGVELTQRTLFERPTVSGLAAAVEAFGGGPPAEEGLPAAPDLARLAVSYSQRRLWFLDRLTPGSPVYNLPWPLLIEGRLVPAALAAVLGEIVRRHEVLRTTYAAGEWDAYQVIHPAASFALPVVALSSLPEHLRRREAQRLAGEDAAAPFDLERGPVLRACLLCLGAAEHHLLLNVHHIAFDGWSLDLLLAELAALYDAFAAGRPSPLAEPLWQYRDFAAWQRSRLAGEILGEQLGFWRHAVAGVPDFLELPADHPRPPAQSFRGATLRSHLPAGLTVALRRLGRERGATLYMLLLAGFQVLLQRYAGQEDLLVGSPIAGRNRTEVEGLIGFFVNTLALRADLAGDPGFGELLARTRETCLAAYAHQELPFELLVEELRPERDLSRPALVQVMLALENASRVPQPSGLRVLPLELDIAAAQFDFELIVREVEDHLATAFTYSADLFEQPTVRRIAAHLEALLQGIVADPERRLSEQPLLRPSERHQLEVAWNDTQSPAEPPSALEGFAAQVQRTPGAVALEAAGERLTYAELDRRANRLAHGLRRCGVERGVPVGLLADRSAEMVVGLLAIWKAGGSYLPLDPEYPKARLAYLLEDSQVQAIAVGTGLAEFLPAHTCRLVPLAAEEREDESELPPAGGPLAGDVAYLIYTSGTTGRPKAVLVEHAQLAATLGAVQEAFGFAPGERMPCIAAFTFDIFLFELLGMLLAGGTCVLLPLRPLLDLERLLDELETATRLHAVPAVMRQIVELARRRGIAAAGLRTLFTGGDAVPADLLAELRATFPGAEVQVLYGPTEAAIVCTTWLVPSEGPVRSLLGRPLPGVEIRLCNPLGRPVPIGVPGEIWIGGAVVTRGYWRREELTAEKFVETGGRRFFRSGDLARRLPDGTLEFLGRADQQVKVRGFRIELGEVEAALASHPAVAEAVVLALPDPAGGNRLVAYVVGVDTPGVSDLRVYLEDHLPKYMVPWGFVILGSLPLAANGKVDRRALAKLEPVAETREKMAPRTPVEEALVRVWEDLLGVPSVGIEDDFFNLGGHSLLAMRALSVVRRAFGVELAPRVLFEHPTVAGLARAVEAARGDVSAPAHAATEAAGPPAIRSVLRDEPLPLSFAQRRLWFLDQLTPDSAVYNLAYPLSLEGRLDAGALRTALTEVVGRHEALRTTFPSLDGEPFQKTAPADSFPLPIVDLQGLEEPIRNAEAAALLGADSVRPFDLGAGPLFRAALLRLAPERHALLLAMHHIVSDGWSMEVLLREMALLYDAFLSGRPSPLPELPVQYADFAVWQRQWLSGEVRSRQLEYWRRQLAGSPAGLDLPTDFPRPAVQTFSGATRWAELPASLSAKLQAFCRREGVTPFMLLLAGFDVLLARYSGQEDVLVGSPIANRNREEIEGLIGFFVNTLVLRSDLSEAASFRELLRQVRETALAAYGHQDLPFEMLVEELRPDRELSRSPLFQVLLAVETARGLPALDHLELSRIEGETATAMFDLSLFATDVGSTLQTLVEYNTDLYEGATIRRLLGHLERLLEGAVADPGKGWRDLPLLSEVEREQLLAGFNDSGSAAGPDLCLHELFEAQARLGPEREALVAPEGVRLSYGELNERAERLARRLRALGLGPEVLAGVLLDRSADLIVALLAVLKAGGAYAPLDPNYPQQRVLLMLETARARVLVTRRRLAESIEQALPAGLSTVYLDPGWEEEPVGESGERAAVLPENLAYVIFTSGSTGVPKGVAIEHRSAVAMIRWARTVYGPEEYAGLLGSTSICFDMSVFEIFATLAEGGKILLAENALALPELAAKEEVVLVDTVPSAMAELLRLGRLPASIRTVNLGGEPLKGTLVEEIYAKLPSVERVVNLYGPSEDTTFTSYAVVPRGAAHPLIGRPTSGESSYVLDGEMRPVPIGVPGALYMGGEGVTRGYLHRPELTAERYIPNPYGPPGSRLYRVGDLVRVLPTGELDFLGRLDHQVKVRGFRIELGEIESALVRHRRVREAAVLAEPEPGGAGNRLIAYVETDNASSELARELRAFLKQSLPDYMVPSQFVRLEALPLTPNGKIDRRALAAMPQHSETAAAGADRIPRSYAEEVLVGIWSEIFGRAVGVDDNFFDLGGHSLLATRVVSRVREAFGIELPVRRLFEQPTVSGLAASVEATLGAGAALEAPRIEPMPRSGPLPLSFAQRRLWFLDQLSPGSPVYNIPYALSLEGRLDAGALEAALTEVVRRHEALRTAFPSLDGEPYQAIAPADPSPLPIVDLQGLEEPIRGAEAAALLEKDSQRPFDLETGPLFRSALLRLAPERHSLLLTMHHIVSDGWSMEVLLRELTALYEAFAADRPSPLPELPVQYADFAVWQRQWLSGEALSRQLEYWRRQLAGSPAGLDLPTDFPRPALQTFNGATRSAELPAELSSSLRAFCRREGVTLFMLLLVGFDALLARYSGQQDVLVGSPIANRIRGEIEGLIGFFVNTLVFRSDLGAAVSFSDLLRQVRETALAAYGHQDLPFETLVEELRPERDLSRSPFFQVLLSVEADRRNPLGLPDLEVSAIEGETGTAKFDLSLFVVDANSALPALVEYNTDLYEGATIQRLLGHLERLLGAAVENPELGWRDLPLLSEGERQQLFAGFDDTGATAGPELCLHELFEAQVRIGPEREALVAPEGARLTYRELDERAERLARRLRALGLDPEGLAGVLMDRTADLIVALLAIHKAGGAYAPLDPSYPKQRVLLMLETARARVLVTRRRLAAALGGDLPAGIETVFLDPGWEEQPVAESGERPAVLPDNLAYLIFTSGSTGVPKGVAIQHRSAVAMIRWAHTMYSPEEYAGLLVSTSICFDMSVFEIFATLAAGGRLILAENALALPELAAKDEAVLVDTVPSAMAELLRIGRLPPSIRTVNLGGEPLKATLVREIYAKLPGVERVVNLYGPSEDTTFTSYAVVPRDTGHPLIGRPLTGEAAYVLDGEMQPVPIGVPGALYMGGEGVTRGYLHRPDLTAERYIPNPYGPPGSRMYRVGDLVRYRPTGELDFLGRLDHQVKVRGFRIELGEIESALTRHGEVREAAVLALPDLLGGNRLVAYVEAERELPAERLRAHLKQSLPDYMVPSLFVRLGELPLTPNGKIDRRALAALPVSGEVVETGERGPRSYAEEVLAGIWSEIFGRPVGVDDNFFDLGGHSLLATRAVSQIREAFGIELPVRRLFEQPTVAGLAESVEAVLGAGAALDAPHIEPAPRSGPLPLSFAQRRLWFLDQLTPGSSVYNIPYPLRLEGRLDAGTLEAALAEVVCRHEALRTTFANFDGEPYQALAAAAPFPLPIVDLEGLEEPIHGAEAGALLAKDSARPFDLGTGPLFRATLLRLAPDRHVLLLTMHHIVSDGWSMEVLLREMASLYEAFAAGRPSPLPELPVQYADFAVWQRRWLSGEALSRQLDYWRRQLAGSPAGLDLPADFPRPAVQTFNGAGCSERLPAELSADLRAFCRREGVTPFMLLLAGFDVLLARYSGQEDVLVGSPIANRNRAETEGLIGFFVNTLVLRSDLGAAASFRSLLRQARETALAAYGHQDLPFETLVEELRPQRDLSRSPFFQVLLSVETAGRSLPRPRDLGLTLIETPIETAKFDLSLFVVDSESGISTMAEYNTDLYEGATVRRLLGHLERLMEGAVADPGKGWRDLPLLSEVEREHLLVGLNDSGSTAGPELCLHELFETQVRIGPEREALVAPEGVRLTYGELDERAERLARRLRTLGLGPEVLAGVLLDRSADLIVTLLAVLKAGGAYAPLDPNYPQQRVLLMLETARAAVLVTRRRLAEALGAELPAGMETVLLDAGWETAPIEESAERPAVLPGNLAYVIFTSGSTGVPKGVAIEHRSAVAMIRWARTVYGPEEYAGMLGSTSICFDMSVFEIFATLAEGGKIVLAENALALPELAAKEEVVLVDTVPSAMAELLRLGRLPPSIRTVNLGGEPLKGTLVEEIYAKLPGVERVVNLYGPSEDTTFTSYAVVPRGAAHPLIGRPISGESSYVLDGEMRPVPIGVPGALYMGGDGVTRGYLHRPELTAERYIPNPYGPPGSRLYRVGDLVRVLRTGELDFLGRLDHQVKVRGFRIELGEIESALVRHGQVREAAVLAEPEPGGAGNRLIAYVETEDASAELARELRAFLKQGLPDYMVPSQFVALAALPLTPNGKIDRRALAALPQHSETAAAGADRIPRSYAEEVLVGSWSEIFGRPVGVDDNFFDLGGHSLLATRAVSQVREAFGIEMPVRRLFEQPTVAGLAESIEAVLGAGAALEAPRIEPVPRSGALPLSFAQRRLWFLDQLSPGSPVYNIPYPLSLEGPLDAAALGAALTEVVRRHEALRTTFPSLDGEPYQAIALAEAFPLPIMDLRGLEERLREAEAAVLLDADSVRSFDLGTGPLFRAALLRLAPERHTLLLTMHHIVSDGWSIEVLLRELTTLYEAFAAGQRSPLPELPVQYADFAVWQRRWLSGEALSRQLGYWRRQLAGVPAGLDLPTDLPRPAVQTFNGASCSTELPADLSAEIQALCRREGVTLFMLLLAAFDVLLARYSGQEDVLVGSPIANRNRAETEGLIGFFVNTLVLRANFGVAASFRDLLGQVRETVLAAQGHQDLPFELLVEELRPERDLSRPPLVQVMLSLENASRVPQPAGLRILPLEVEAAAAKFDLDLSVRELQSRLAAALTYNTDLFEEPTVRRITAHLETVLRGMVADPERRISEQTLLRESERHQLLMEWNDTRRAAEPWFVVERFSAQVAKSPDAVALETARDGRLSYAELDRRANRLAHRLRRVGVGPGTAVGLFVERSAEMVIGLLAIWKAGGAYLPLDPEYPPARLAYLLEDSQVPVVAAGTGLADALPPHTSRIVPIAAPDLVAESDLAPAGTPQAGDLAYQIYTSGSTGEPKAVQVEHGQLAVTLAAVQAAFSFGPGERMPCIASYTFDIFLFELIGMLLSGGTCVLVPLRPALDLERLVGELETATLLHAVPALMRQVVDLARSRGLAAPGLRALFTGGDAVPADLLADLRAAFPAAEVWVLYGPTEAAIVCTSWQVPAEGPIRPLLGRPLAGSEIRLSDAAGRSVPIGVRGEIWIGGAVVTRGYWRREGLTAEKFMEIGGRRFFRSGDLARRLPDGTLEFLGRADQQVKVRGFRIELGEVEAAVSSHPAVAKAVVLALPDPAGTGKRLVAYLEPDGAGGASAAGPAREVRRYLEQRLPDYMVPSVFVWLGELPLTANGKIDRRTLAAMPVTGERAAAEDRAPRSYVEEVLAGIWSELFGHAVGVGDNFFDLGGHSLLATRVVSRIRSALDVELPLQQIFAAPTVESLAASVERQIAARRGVPLPPIERSRREGELPLSFSQQRLWLLDRLDPGTSTFNLPAPLRLAGFLNVGALARALAGIVQRHESLRTVFAEREGRACQIVLAGVPLSLPIVDLVGLPVEPREAEAQRLVEAEARLPFELTRGPLLRITLLRLAADEHLLQVTMHHIVTDGWSTSVFARELAALYEAAVTGRPSPLPELPFQYPDFALWQRRALDGATIVALFSRWKERFGTDLPVLRLPTDRPRPALPASPGGYRYAVLPPDLTEGIRKLARASGTTLFMTLLAAFQALLARYTGQEKIVVGSPVAGRDRAELEGLIGFFVNTVVLPADFSGDPSFAELLERVRDMALAAYDCQALPFEKLVEELQPQRERNRSPLFQVMFSLQNESESAGGSAAGLTLFPVPATNGASQFDLTLAIAEAPERLWAVVEYNTELFDASTIERLLEHYQRLLTAAAADPDTRVSALPPAAEELPRALPEAVVAAAEPVPDLDSRRARLAARLSKLPQAQREALERRLRGGGAV
jgi:amino acid adenylation domain-containing protein